MKYAIALFLFSFLIVTEMASCKSEEKKQKSLNGFDVVFLDNKKGDVAKEGDWVFLRYYMMAKDSLIFSSMMQSPIVKFQLTKLERVQNNERAQPLIDVLHMMSKGDSALVTQKFDDQMKKTMNLPNINSLDFHVKLVDVKSEVEYQKEISNQLQ